MFCRNCGKKINDEAKFCPFCGTVVQQMQQPGGDVNAEYYAGANEGGDVNAEYYAGANEGGNVNAEYYAGANEGGDVNAEYYTGTGDFAEPQFEPVGQKKPGKKKIIGLAAGIVAVLLLIIGAFNFNRIYGAVIRTFGSPKSYFEYVELKEFEKYVDMGADYYGSMLLDNLKDDRSIQSKVSFQFSDSALDLIEDLGLDGEDLAWLNEVSLNFDYNMFQDRAEFQTGLTVSDEEIPAVGSMIDFAAGEMFLSLPELTDKVIRSESAMEEMLEDYGEGYDISEKPFQKILAVKESLPSKSTVQKLLKKYVEIIIKNVKDISRQDSTVSVEGITQKCTELKAEISEKEFFAIEEAVLTAMKNDREIRSIVESLQNQAEDMELSGADEDAYEVLLEWIDNSLEAVEYYKEDASEEEVLRVVSYVDNSHEVIGWELGIEGDVPLRYVTAHDGKQFATEMQWQDELIITGTGTENGYKRSGVFNVSAEDADLWELTVEDFDSEKLEKGYLDGTFRIKPGRDLFSTTGLDEELFSSTISLPDLAVELKCETSKKNNSFTVAVLNNDENFAGFKLDLALSDGKAITKPEGDVIDGDNSEEMQEFVESLDYDKVLRKLEDAGVPESLTGLLESVLEFGDYSSDDYDYDDYSLDDYDFGW